MPEVTSPAGTITPAAANNAPLPPGPPLWSTPLWLLRARSNPLTTFDRLAEQHGDVALMGVPGVRVVVLRGSEAARQVLLTNQDNYPKAQQFDMFKPALGEGLVTSKGELWRQHRKMVQPLFAKRYLPQYADHMTAAAETALSQWDEHWPDGEARDVDMEILHAGLDTVGRALVSHDFTHDAGIFETAMAEGLRDIGLMSRSPGVMIGQDLPGLNINRAARLMTPRRWRHYLRTIENGIGVITALVDERLANGQGGRDDLLSLLMESEDEETGERLSRQHVVDEVMTFVAAGHETTAHGLAWMFHLLARNPEARERLEAEVDTVLAGRPPDAETADQLPWMTACFQEAMRVYPPVWHIPRFAARDDVVCGYRIPAGARVMVSVWSTHRDPNVWPNPERFDPTRWLDDAHKERPRFSYLPFGAGRRACVGQGFAQLNANILGAMIVQRFRLEDRSQGEIETEATITLRPRYSIPMAITRR